MKGFHSAAALAALMLAACADQGPTAPPLAPDGALGINGIQASLTDADENPLMIFMGGGIEGIPAGSDPRSVDALSMELAQAAGFSTIDVQGASATRAFGINAVGQIVGSYTDAAGTPSWVMPALVAEFRTTGRPRRRPGRATASATSCDDTVSRATRGPSRSCCRTACSPISTLPDTALQCRSRSGTRRSSRRPRY